MALYIVPLLNLMEGLIAVVILLQIIKGYHLILLKTLKATLLKISIVEYFWIHSTGQCRKSDQKKRK